MKTKRWVFPVSAQRLAWCQERIEVYKTRGNLQVVLPPADENLFHLSLIQELRRNHQLRQSGLAGPAITPERFRHVANMLIQMHLNREFEHKNQHTKIPLPPWRAGLAYLRTFADMADFVRWPAHVYHLGASRDEKTLETKIYFDEPPAILRDNKFSPGEIAHFYIIDPMLASGKTTMTAINKLMNYHVRRRPVTDAMITVLSLFAAPEGIVRIVEAFPDIKISTLVLDDHLDKNGFIVPGLGDFGDQYFDGLTIDSFHHYLNQGWMSSAAFQALAERMAKTLEVKNDLPKGKVLKFEKK